MFPFLQLGGTWRPFFDDDRVDLWLDASGWFPLRYTVYPSTDPARTPWELRFGIPHEPTDEPIFDVRLSSLDPNAPDPATFEVPGWSSAPSVPLASFPRRVGYLPVTPTSPGALTLSSAVVPPGDDPDAPKSVLLYTDGMAYVRIGERPDWTAPRLFGPVDQGAQQVDLSGGGVAYYEPAGDGLGRRLAIHASTTNVFLESNLPRAQLLTLAASLPVRGEALPDAWRTLTGSGISIEQVAPDVALARSPIAVALPPTLPAGYVLASGQVVSNADAAGTDVIAVSFVFRQRQSDAVGGPIVLHVQAGAALPPASSADQLVVSLDGARARWTPGRGQLEWIAGGAYLSLEGGAGPADPARPRVAGAARRTGDPMRSVPKVLAGLVVGLILGATVTLAVQSRGEQLDDARPPASIASPAPRGEPEAPATFLAWVPGGLPHGFTRSVANLPSIDRITSVAEDNVWMTRSWSADGALVDHPTGPYAIPIDAAAVSPRSFGAFLPPPDRAVVAALADGQGVLGATSAELRGLGPGAELAFGGTRIRIVDVLPDELVGAAELLVSKATGAAIGVHRERYLLLQPHDGATLTSAALRARLTPLLPPGLGIYQHVQVRAPGETPYFRSGDAVLPPVLLKSLFGEFAARPSPGRPGYLDIDPAWVRTHIVTVQVPLLGERHVQPRDHPPAPRRHVVAAASRARLPDPFVRRLLRAEVREP